MLDEYVCEFVNGFVIGFRAINNGGGIPPLEFSECRKSHCHAKEDDAHAENGCQRIVAVEQVGFLEQPLKGLEMVRPLTAGEVKLGRVGGKEVVHFNDLLRTLPKIFCQVDAALLRRHVPPVWFHGEDVEQEAGEQSILA